MTTEAQLLQRVRLEIGDLLTPFQATIRGDGLVRRFELPNSPVSQTGLSVAIADTTSVPATVTALTPSQYTLDTENGLITLQETLPAGRDLVVRGMASKYFDDAAYLTFIRTAAAQHLHNRSGVSLTTLPVVEEYPVALLATIEALHALLNDAAFDIDVSTPEGVGIPRSQRFRQLTEMLQLRQQQYAEMSSALNVGLSRIEVFSLRRVSRTTGRLVPVYVPQELEDRQPARRVFTPIDTHGGAAIVDPTPVLDISMYEYGYFTIDIDGLGDLTPWQVDARMRRYEDSSSIREMTVVIRDIAAGNITLDLEPRQTAHLPSQLFWDLRLTNRATREVRTLRKGTATVIQQVGVDEAVGPIAGY